jgi:hypothetical protein
MRAPLPQLEIDFTDTSQEAFDSIIPHLGRIEAEVFRVISEAGSRGATSDEVEVALEMRHQTVSSRIWALGRRGVVRDSGQRRKTRSGRNAACWVSTVGPTEVA